MNRKSRDRNDIEIVPATIDRWDALAALFETPSGVNGCWCMWPRRAPMTHRPDPERNRAEMKGLLAAREPPGLLALRAERAAGWCAVGPRSRYPQYEEAPIGAGARMPELRRTLRSGAGGGFGARRSK